MLLFKFKSLAPPPWQQTKALQIRDLWTSDNSSAVMAVPGQEQLDRQASAV